MKITKKQLAKLIQEETEAVLKEQVRSWPNKPPPRSDGRWRLGNPFNWSDDGTELTKQSDFMKHSIVGAGGVSKGKGANPDKYKRKVMTKNPDRLFASDWKDWPVEAQLNFCKKNKGKPTVSVGGKRVPAPGPTCRDLAKLMQEQKIRPANIPSANPGDYSSGQVGGANPDQYNRPAPVMPSKIMGEIEDIKGRLRWIETNMVLKNPDKSIEEAEIALREKLGPGVPGARRRGVSLDDLERYVFTSIQPLQDELKKLTKLVNITRKIQTRHGEILKEIDPEI